MWVVDFDRLLGVRGKASRAVFAHLLDRMDAQSQSTSLGSSIRGDYTKQRISLALLDLQRLGLIRRGSNCCTWKVIWVNPAVVRPWWLKGDLYAQRLDAFEQGPTGLGKKLMDEQA